MKNQQLYMKKIPILERATRSFSLLTSIVNI